ncbi:MAG: transglycosylase SLT domain-containing protein [Gammaproteobacteria bacterium]|nr:transglycosylase SLT domain-containing protein [Gammaproteobacteria bacterium]
MKANKRWLALALGLAALVPAMVDAADERERQREVFREGWQAAAQGRETDIIDAIERLDGYPLKPYLQFELLRQEVDRIPDSAMTRFLARYPDWSFTPALETAWLRSLGERDRFDALLAHGRDVNDTTVRCHVARARLAAGETDGLEAVVEQLWRVGRSQPDACDPVFAWWHRQGNPDPETAWQRFLLAFDNGQRSLAAYLRRHLSADKRSWADRWLNMRSSPADVLREARDWRDHEQSREIVRYGIERLVRDDWERAAEAWSPLAAHFAWTPSVRRSIERELALFQAVALDEAAVAAVDRLPEAAIDDHLLAWRARVALARGQWPAVLESIGSMSSREQARSRWRYWRARALAALNETEAAVVFASLSAETDYYGFLAAAWLGRPLSLCAQDIPVDSAIQRRLWRDPELERAFELFHVGLYWHARRTWRHVFPRLTRIEREQAALFAAGEGWHDLAIRTFNNIGHRRAYAWRFPLAEQERVVAAAEEYGVDPALVYGLMRAESAMQPDARSSAGALGLLQLMPDTAAAVARRSGLSYPGAGALHDPAVNVPLGVAHLGELQVHFAGDWARIAAAYNAGANAVRRWLDERPDNPPDIWIETLPYYETRDYVPRVLAFATIYEWQLQQQPDILIRHVLPNRPSRGFDCPL